MQTRRVALAFVVACGLGLSGSAAAQAAPPPVSTVECSGGFHARNVRTGAWNQKVTVSTCVKVTTYYDGHVRVTASTHVVNRGVRPMRRLRTTTGVRKRAGTWYSHLSARDRLGRANGVLVGSSSHSYVNSSFCTRWHGDGFLTFRVYFRGEGWRYYKAHSTETYMEAPKSVCH